MFHASFYKTKLSQCKLKWWYAENFKSFRKLSEEWKQCAGNNRKSNEIFWDFIFCSLEMQHLLCWSTNPPEIYESTNKRIIEQKSTVTRIKVNLIVCVCASIQGCTIMGEILKHQIPYAETSWTPQLTTRIKNKQHYAHCIVIWNGKLLYLIAVSGSFAAVAFSIGAIEVNQVDLTVPFTVIFLLFLFENLIDFLFFLLKKMSFHQFDLFGKRNWLFEQKKMFSIEKREHNSDTDIWWREKIE